MEIKNIGQLVNQLALKAGIDKDDKNLISLLSNADLSKIPIHSELVAALDENLLSISAAKDNHPEIASIYRAQALDGLDKRINTVLAGLNLEEEEANEIKAQRNSYKKLELVIEKLKETKKATPDKGEKDGLQKQVDTLLAELKIAKETTETEKATYETNRTKDKIEYKMREKLAGYKTILDELDPEVRFSTLITAINKALQAQDAELKFDDNGDLVPIKKDGSKLLGANHTPVTLQSLIDSTMAQNKLPLVTKAPVPLPGPAPIVTPGQATPSGANQSVAIHARAQREAFEMNAATR